MTPEQEAALARARAKVGVQPQFSPAQQQALERARAATGAPVTVSASPAAEPGSFRAAQRKAVTEDPGALGASVTGGGQGLTFGFGDELLAGAFTPLEMAIGAFTGEDEGKGVLDRVSSSYGRGLDLQRAQIKTAEKNHPVASTVGELGGGVALGAAASPSLFPTGAGVVGNALRGAGFGGISGAFAGFGEGEGLDDRTDKALSGGLFGLGIGAAAPMAGAAMGSGVRAVRDSKIARDVLAPVGLGRRSAEQLEREMGRDGLTAATARAEADRMGPDAMALDVGRNLGEAPRRSPTCRVLVRPPFAIVCANGATPRRPALRPLQTRLWGRSGTSPRRSTI